MQLTPHERQILEQIVAAVFEESVVQFGKEIVRRVERRSERIVEQTVEQNVEVGRSIPQEVAARRPMHHGGDH